MPCINYNVKQSLRDWVQLKTNLVNRILKLREEMLNKTIGKETRHIPYKRKLTDGVSELFVRDVLKVQLTERQHISRQKWLNKVPFVAGR